jgi:hypothetical protein
MKSICFTVMVLLIAVGDAGCALFSGYPADPQPSTALDDLRSKYFSQNVEDCYNAGACASLPHLAGKQAIRDDVVLTRMHIYDMEFTLFARELSGGNNTISLGGDLTALALNGLGATTGSSATKAALAAASGGIIAANGAVNKDLFYQKTIPAIVTQMEADREKVEAVIFAGLKQPDDKYPLQRAVIDLDALNNAGSINGAVANITQQATGAKVDSQKSIDDLRLGKFSISASSSTIRTWVKASKTNLEALKTWWKSNAPRDYVSALPFPEQLENNDDEFFEALRQKAIGDLSIK